MKSASSTANGSGPQSAKTLDNLENVDNRQKLKSIVEKGVKIAKVEKCEFPN